jgi:hypothetical protein
MIERMFECGFESEWCKCSKIKKQNKKQGAKKDPNFKGLDLVVTSIRQTFRHKCYGFFFCKKQNPKPLFAASHSHNTLLCSH